MKNCYLKSIFLLFVLCLPSMVLSQENNMEFIMDMVHNNPGETPYVTKYNDGEILRDLGYNSIVTHWHINCAIDYSSFSTSLSKGNRDEQKWVKAKASVIHQKLDSLKDAGLMVFPFTDFLVFPKSVWDKYGDQIAGVGSVASDGASGNRARRVNIQSPMTQKLLRFQISEIFRQFPLLDGLVVRFGETYLQDTPYHMGGSPISQKNAIEDHILFLQILREEVCEKLNKKLFYRTWDFGYNFHCNPDFYLKVTNSIKPHENLFFAIKYQQGDFHRNCQFNPTIGIGIHRQVIEAQCRMEAYGKGAHPYYTAQGVIDGWPETKFEIEWDDYKILNTLRDKNKPRGVKDVLSSNLIAGIMTWSNGGGWQGPYIKHEIWTDLNCFVLSHWAKNTTESEPEIFYDFCERIGLDNFNSELLRQISLLSIEGVRKGTLNSFCSNQVWWARDEFFSVKDNAAVIAEIKKNHLERKIIAEKDEAVAIWEQIEALSRQFDSKDVLLNEAVETSCTYGRIKFSLMRQMWIMMIAYEGDDSSQYKESQLKILSDAIVTYDRLWDEWRQLHDNKNTCASLYTELAFRNNYNGSIGELVSKIRILVEQ